MIPRAEAIKVVCPRCKAAAGEKCIGERGTRSAYHQERHRARMKAMSGAAEPAAKVSKSVERKEKYAAYLQTPEWHARRDAALEHAEHRCQVCNETEQLVVHHRTYERRGEESPRDLTVLCDSCHALFHGVKKAKPKSRKARNKSTKARKHRKHERVFSVEPGTSPVLRQKPDYMPLDGKILRALRERNEISTKELFIATGRKKQHIREALTVLALTKQIYEIAPGKWSRKPKSA